MKHYAFSKLVAIAVLAISASAIAGAQSSGPAGGQLTAAKPAHHGQHPLKVALAKLNLSAKQKAQIAGMLKQRAADNKAFRKANQGNLPALKAHRKQESQAFMTSLKGVLTQSQWTQLQADLKAMKGKVRHNPTPGSTPPAPL